MDDGSPLATRVIVLNLVSHKQCSLKAASPSADRKSAVLSLQILLHPQKMH
jgi:hypothetical protein